MEVRIKQEDGYWVVPCRDFAAVQLGKNIRSRYRTKGNAVRAILNPNYNTITLLCHNLEQLYTRLAYCENLLFKVQTLTKGQEDVWGLVGDCATASDSSVSGGVDGNFGGGIVTGEGAIGCSDGDNEGADGNNEGTSGCVGASECAT
jgi:hypothetical protein